jgi:uncharacterized protein (TIGR02147 family)
LNKTEAQFFESLVHFNQSETVEKKSVFAEKIMRTRRNRQIHPLTQAQFEYYSYWYHIPIRELVALPEFREDYVWMAQKISPNITADQARRAVQVLLRLGLLARENEKLRQRHAVLNTANEVLSYSVANYHREMLRLAADSLIRVAKPQREISALCMGVSRETAKKIKTRLQEFREEMLTLCAEDATPEHVYQLNIQLFPLTRMDRDDDNI